MEITSIKLKFKRISIFILIFILQDFFVNFYFFFDVDKIQGSYLNYVTQKIFI
jgi:hypothetical protein